MGVGVLRRVPRRSCSESFEVLRPPPRERKYTVASISFFDFSPLMGRGLGLVLEAAGADSAADDDDGESVPAALVEAIESIWRGSIICVAEETISEEYEAGEVCG